VFLDEIKSGGPRGHGVIDGSADAELHAGA
jgi:hypothetical protein